jgi:hypothetical protein
LIILEGKQVEKHGICPACGADWDAGLVPEESISKGHYDVGSHWSNIIGIQLSYDSPHHYDGISIWHCPFCGQNWCRWCGERLKPEETHPPFHD